VHNPKYFIIIDHPFPTIAPRTTSEAASSRVAEEI